MNDQSLCLNLIKITNLNISILNTKQGNDLNDPEIHLEKNYFIQILEKDIFVLYKNNEELYESNFPGILIYLKKLKNSNLI